MKTAEDYFIEGNNKVLIKDNKGAIAEYLKAIEIDSSDDASWFNHGITKLKLKDFSGAVADLSKSLELHPEDANAYYFRSVARDNSNDPFGAASDILKAFVIDPKLKFNTQEDNPIYEGINYYIKTIIDYTKAIEYNPWDTEAYRKRALLKELARDFNGAIEDYTKIIGMDSCNVGAYYKRGYIKDFHLKDHTGALADFDEALKIIPNNEEVLFSRGNIKYSFNDNQGTIADCTAIIEMADSIDPDDLEDFEYFLLIAYQMRGNSKKNLHDFSGAIDDYTKAIKLDPDDEMIFCNRGKAKIELNDYKGAITDFNKAIKIKPEFGNAYYHRGLAKIQLGQENSGSLDLIKAKEFGHQNAEKAIKENCKLP